MDGTDINAACRGKAHGEWYLFTAEDSGWVKLPCVVKHSPWDSARSWDAGRASGEGVGCAPPPSNRKFRS